MEDEERKQYLINQILEWNRAVYSGHSLKDLEQMVQQLGFFRENHPEMDVLKPTTPE